VPSRSLHGDLSSEELERPLGRALLDLRDRGLEVRDADVARAAELLRVLDDADHRPLGPRCGSDLQADSHASLARAQS